MNRTAFDELQDDEYSTAPEAAQLALLLINKVDQHGILSDARIGFLFRDQEISNGGKVEAASAHLARFQGPSFKRWGRFMEWSLSRVFGFEPDLLVLIDRNIWGGLDASQKLALIDHELSHFAQAETADGAPRFDKLTEAPIWKIVAHDVEEFCGVVERHGLWNGDLVEMARAMIDALAAEPALAGAEAM